MDEMSIEMCPFWEGTGHRSWRIPSRFALAGGRCPDYQLVRSWFPVWQDMVVVFGRVEAASPEETMSNCTVTGRGMRFYGVVLVWNRFVCFFLAVIHCRKVPKKHIEAKWKG